MELNEGKIHPVFDMDFARKIYAGWSEKLEGEQITSPFDLYSVEELRKQHKLNQGESFPTDVFVFGKGPHHERSITKVGGVPYWPQSRAWPTDQEGNPYSFLAQFNFAESADLFVNRDAKPPGILLIFVPADSEDWLWEPEMIHFEWVKPGIKPIKQLPNSVPQFAHGEWYGVRHRSADYPATKETAENSKVRQRYNVANLSGTKIGGFGSYKDDPRFHYLCQLSSIQAAPDVPFPWTN